MDLIDLKQKLAQINAEQVETEIMHP